MKKLIQIFFLAAVVFAFAAALTVEAEVPDGFGSILTFYSGQNQFAGNMFDITNIGPVPITIISFDVHLETGGSSALISVYSTPGTYVGNESDPGPWTIMGFDFVESAGTGNPTPVSIGGLRINPGESYGLYVTVSNYPSAHMRYTNLDIVMSNANVQLTLGVGKGHPDFTGDTFLSRSWNGTIYYDILPPPPVQLAKDDGGVSISFGSTVSYTLSYASTTNQDLSNVIITDTVPAGTTFDPTGSSPGWSGCVEGSPSGTICTYPLGSLFPGQTGSVVFAARVPIVGSTSYTITNIAELGYSLSYPGGYPVTASDTTPVIIYNLFLPSIRSD